MKFELNDPYSIKHEYFNFNSYKQIINSLHLIHFLINLLKENLNQFQAIN